MLARMICDTSYWHSFFNKLQPDPWLRWINGAVIQLPLPAHLVHVGSCWVADLRNSKTQNTNMDLVWYIDLGCLTLVVHPQNRHCQWQTVTHRSSRPSLIRLWALLRGKATLASRSLIACAARLMVALHASNQDAWCEEIKISVDCTFSYGFGWCVGSNTHFCKV